MKKLFSFILCSVFTVTGIAVAQMPQQIVVLDYENVENGGVQPQSSSGNGDKAVGSRNPDPTGINTSSRVGKYTHKKDQYVTEEQQVGRLNSNIPAVHLGYYDSFEFKAYIPSTTKSGGFQIALCSDGPDRGSDPNVERENWERQYITYPNIPENSNFDPIRDQWFKIERGGYISSRELGMVQFGYRRGAGGADYNSETEILYFDDFIFRLRNDNKIPTYRETFYFYGEDPANEGKGSWKGDPNTEYKMYPGKSWEVTMQTGKDRWIGGVALTTSYAEFEWESGHDHVLVLANDIEDVQILNIPVLPRLENLTLQVDVKSKAPIIEYRLNGAGDWTAVDFSSSSTVVGPTWNTFTFDISAEHVDNVDLRLSGREVAGISYVDNVTIWGSDPQFVPNSIPSVESSSNIKIYPNPVEDVLTIQGDVKNVDIYDLQGKLVLSDTKSEINVENLRAGIYVTKIRTAEGIFATKIYKK